MITDLIPDLQKLCREAEVAEDERSKKIYESIEDWIKEVMKKVSRGLSIESMGNKDKMSEEFDFE